MNMNKTSSKTILSTMFVVLTLVLAGVTGCRHNEIEQNPNNRIVVELESGPEFNTDNIRKFEFSPINQIGSSNQLNLVKAKKSKKKASWVFYSNGPVMIDTDFGFFQLLKPGDSVYIKSLHNDLVFSGKGSERAAIWYQIIKAKNKLVKPTRHSFAINSLADYFRWNKYVDNRLELQISILDSQKHRLQEEEYNFLKSAIVENAENDRVNAFAGLRDYSLKNAPSILTGSELSAIWDSTQNKLWSKWLRSLPNYYGPMNTLYALNKGEVFRRFSFDFANDSLNSKDLRTYLYYATAKNNFEGLTRERLMAYILDEQTIREMGVDNPMTQSMLKDYYSLSGFPEYKAWVKGLEKDRAK